MIEQILNELKEFVNRLALKERALNDAVNAANSKLKEADHVFETNNAERKSLAEKEASLKARDAKILHGEEFSKQQQEFERERTEFRVMKEKEEKRIKQESETLKNEKAALEARSKKLEERELNLSREKESYKQRILDEMTAKLKV